MPNDLWGGLTEAIRALLMDGARETTIQYEVDDIFVKWHKEGVPPQGRTDDEGEAIPELVKLFSELNDEPSGSVDTLSSINSRLLNLEGRILSLELRLSQPQMTTAPYTQPTTAPPNPFSPTTYPGYISGCQCGGTCGC